MARIFKGHGSGLVTSKLRVPAGTDLLAIDQSHPLSVGLTSAFLPGRTLGYDYFRACRTLDYFDNGAALASTGTMVNTPEGPAMGCGTDGRRSLNNVNGITPLSISKWTTEASFYVRFFQSGSANPGSAVMFVDDGGNCAMGFAPPGGGASNVFTFYCNAFSAPAGGTAVAVNKTHGALGAYKVGGLTSTLWMDGASYVTLTNANNPANVAANTAIGLGQNVDVKILAFYTWRRALNIQEANMLEADPYGIFQAASTNLWFSAETSGFVGSVEGIVPEWWS